MNPYEPPHTDSATLEKIVAPQGFRRGWLNGWRYSRAWALLSGTTAAIYGFGGVAKSDVQLSSFECFRVAGWVLVYYAAVPLVWCFSAGIVAWIVAWIQNRSRR